MALVVTHRPLSLLAALLAVACNSPSPAPRNLNTGAQERPPQPAGPTASPTPTPAPTPTNEPANEPTNDPPPPSRSEYVEVLVGPDPGPRGRVVIVALHGLGDTPEAFSNWIRALNVSARVLAVRAPEDFGSGSAWWQPGGDESFTARALVRSVAEVERRVGSKIATSSTCGTPIVLGFSQGAMVSFAIATRGALGTRLVIPIAGRLPQEALGAARPAATRPRVRAMHGEVDARIAITAGRNTVAALVRQGYDATLQGFAGVDHSITDAMRSVILSEIERAARSMGCAP